MDVMDESLCQAVRAVSEKVMIGTDCLGEREMQGSSVCVR